jgi:Skp family chaperone for outer membrane proteins
MGKSLMAVRLSGLFTLQRAGRNQGGHRQLPASDGRIRTGQEPVRYLQDEFAPRQRGAATEAERLAGQQDKLTRDGAVMAEKDRTALEKELTRASANCRAKARPSPKK